MLTERNGYAEVKVEGYTIIRVISEKWGIRTKKNSNFHSMGKISRVVEFGHERAISVGIQCPEDSRVTTGVHKNWMNKSENN